MSAAGVAVAYPDVGVRNRDGVARRPLWDPGGGDRPRLGGRGRGERREVGSCETRICKRELKGDEIRFLLTRLFKISH